MQVEDCTECGGPIRDGESSCPPDAPNRRHDDCRKAKETAVMSDADLAVKLWEQYAPVHRLILECDAAEDAYEAQALDEGKECWVTVARARNMTDAMMMAVARVKDMRPGGPITEYDDEVVGPADLNTEHWDEYRRAKEEGRTLEQLHRVPARLRDCPSPWHDESHGVHSSCPACSGTKRRRA